MVQDRLGFTAVYVTHDQSEAFGLADRIIVMNRGHIDPEGPPREMFDRPQTPFGAEFLGLKGHAGQVIRVADAPPFALPASGTGHQWAQVELVGGTAVWGKVGHDRPLGMGRKALLCVRKEHVRVAAPSAPAPDQQAFAATVRAASFQGLCEEYIIDLSGVEFRAIQPSAGALTRESVNVGLAAHDCIVLSNEA